MKLRKTDKAKKATGREQYSRQKMQNTYYRPDRAVVSQQEKPGRANRIVRICVVLVVIGLFGYLIYSSRTPIIRISDSSRPAQEVSVYRGSIEEILNNSPLYMTKLSFDYNGLSKQLRERHPEISSVTSSFGLIGDQPVISLSFYEPAFLATSNGQQWIIDSRGVAITELSTDQLKARYSSLININDDIGLIRAPGDTLISGADAKYIESIKYQLEGKGYVVKSITIPSSPRELDVVLDGENYRIRFSLDQQSEEQAGAAIAAIATLKKSGQTIQEYLDVRPGEKVYWK
jgi:hypothetical protein